MSKRPPYPSQRDSGAPGVGEQVFWRSLDSKADPAAAQVAAEAEFPLKLEAPVVARTVAADDASKETVVGRRGILRLAGTAAVASTLAACRRPVEKLVPYTKQVEYSVPGIAYHYASARVERGDVVGLLAEVHENRPTKLEGNPDHPGNRGTSDLRSQAAILDLYDPDRPGKITRLDGGKRVDANPAELEKVLADLVAKSGATQGARLRLLVEPSISPTFLRLRDAFKAKYPQAKVYTWTPLDPTSVREGSRIAFGQVLNPVPDFAVAKAILALDSDFLQTEPGMLRATRGFVRSRQAHRPTEAMSRLYVVEPGHTTTGSNADNRLRLPARDIEGYLLALVRELATKYGQGLALGQYASIPSELPAGVPAPWVASVAKNLAAHRGKSLIVVGARQPARVHALAHAVNAALGNLGEAVHLYPVADEDQGDGVADLKQLAADLDGNGVDVLVTLGGNPVYDAPSDLRFGEKMAKAKTTIHLGSHLDETGARSTWFVPRAHELEAWGDARALDGTVSVIQPVIAPLHDGWSDLQLMAKLVGEPATAGSEAVQATFRSSARKPLTNFDRVWNTALQRGVVDGVPSRPVPAPTPVGASIVAAFAAKKPARPLAPANLEVNFAPDPKLLDGRHANNPWLLELPDPLSKLVWDNAAYVSPTTAKALGVANNDVVTLSRDGGGSLEVPIWVLPGVADYCVSLHLGWGRTHAGRYGGRPENATDDRYAGPAGIYPFVQGMPHDGSLRGFNAYAIRSSDALGFGDGFKAEKTGKTYKLVTTHEHQSMEGRPIALDATVEELKKLPDFPQWKTPDPKVLPLWTPQEYPEHKWGMAIDMSMCTGCNACTIACQAENNIAFVGKDQVSRGREMYWIRVDRYFVGDSEADPKVAYQPVACVHCEQAPCENVCPVNATEHSPEGLNDMAYNRCVGTRYCANNCPYKVRRFNYLEFQGDPMYGDLPETLKMQFNPNVTVRMRGVMEKCTYCVQRIEEARISARRDSRPMKDGDIDPACAQACPANAIVFGDLNEPRSRVASLTGMGRGYRLLSELGTHPRTTHLGKIRNPNTEMA
jgi:molybdopterin-containing oxidoreductase family iron-sulfur binding subunit